MITELALLTLRPDAAPAFETAFASVAGLLAGADGHLAHRLVRTLDHPDVYMLEVQWRDLAAHVDQFERSAEHARFLAAIDAFLAAAPHVLHVPAHS